MKQRVYAVALLMLCRRFWWNIGVMIVMSHCLEMNIAKGGIATGSSQYRIASSDKAIDGNSDTNWNRGSCSSTNTENVPWWRLDLLRPYKINRVTVTVREDWHYRQINGAEIRIGNFLDHNGNINPRYAHTA